MIRLLMPLIIGLLMGTGVGTGVFIMRGGSGESAASEDVQPDTLAHAESEAEPEVESGSSTGTPDIETAAATDDHNEVELASNPETDPQPATNPPQGTDTQPATDSQQPAPPDPNVAEASEPMPAGATGVESAGGVPQTAPIQPIGGANLANNVEAAGRLAKIFSTMQARDAAKVLSLMDPSEMELVLRQLDNRSAAKILAGLDAELAATLSQALMRPGGER